MADASKALNDLLNWCRTGKPEDPHDCTAVVTDGGGQPYLGQVALKKPLQGIGPSGIDSLAGSASRFRESSNPLRAPQIDHVDVTLVSNPFSTPSQIYVTLKFWVPLKGVIKTATAALTSVDVDQGSNEGEYVFLQFENQYKLALTARHTPRA
jgi:hypothetical protein